MPEPDSDILARKEELLAGLRTLLPESGLIADPVRLQAFESDGLTIIHALPLAVVLPDKKEQIPDILRLCARLGVKVVPRGAGTGLSGGALPLADGIVLGLSKLSRILDIDIDNRAVTVEPGVTNLAITRAVEGRGYYYAPDPSSQIACTIGGNVAENAGGVHCLKYGLTTNNVLGLELMLMNGETVRLGGKHLDAEAYDLMGVVTGSEGLLGIVTEVTVRILKKPEQVRAALIAFASIEDAGACVGAIIAAGIIPAALEIMDKAAVGAVEAYCQPGYPLDAEAVLVVELDGVSAEIDALCAKIQAIASRCQATTIRFSGSDEERLALWAGRKAAFPAVGRLAPDYICMDGTIPRRTLPRMLREMKALSGRFGLPLVNVFHAGDGNLHPLILFDANKPGDVEKAEELGAAILTLCVEMGGVLSGEHGIGVEKRDLMGKMFGEEDLNQQMRLKCAFDPAGRLNPGKIFPTLHACVELGRMHVHRGRLPFPALPRL
jgi:glycolate dehydrogenase FAD-linked subunit